MIDRVERETPLEVTSEELWSLQEGDGTLEAVRKAASGEACSGGIGFFKRDGLLFRRWTPPTGLAKVCFISVECWPVEALQNPPGRFVFANVSC